MRDRIPIPRIARDARLIRRRMYFPIYFRGRSSRNKFRAIDKIMRSNLVDGSFTEEKRTRYGDFFRAASVVPLSRHSHLFHGGEFPSTRRPRGTRLSNYRNSRGFIAANNLLTRFLRTGRQIFAQPKSGIFSKRQDHHCESL